MITELQNNSIFMSHEQLVDLTGATRSNKQAEILEANGIPYTRDIRSRPKVLLSVFHEVMLGRNNKKKKSGPNLDRLRGLQNGQG